MTKHFRLPRRPQHRTIVHNKAKEFKKYSLDSCTIPFIWKVAKVILVNKKGSKKIPSNYRPISLTCITCKTLECIVSSMIHEHLNSYNILHDIQHGFRKGRSCDSQLAHTLNKFTLNLDRKVVPDVVILDFSKTSDTVDHRKLLLKLNHYGIHKQLIQSRSQNRRSGNSGFDHRNKLSQRFQFTHSTIF